MESTVHAEGNRILLHFLDTRGPGAAVVLHKEEVSGGSEWESLRYRCDAACSGREKKKRRKTQKKKKKKIVRMQSPAEHEE